MVRKRRKLHKKREAKIDTTMKKAHKETKVMVLGKS